ncbi:SPOR domain-containing protein [Halomonas beimenensis]|uniref:Septum-associated cell division protein DedD n=1 Tax=Halomonas beimenensis TaxID=475662 RepID=A0A291P8A1_9GAMM|nr:SPOR domain-containing protein [Halomonas beimenensis]ATJ83099.1 septum-associated cell division protein DedD [Halomonas beimenensis]
MKYGLRERVSGGLILIALAVIFVPLLFDDPAPREERPEPMLTIEQPVEVERQSLEDPVPPQSLGEQAGQEASTMGADPAEAGEVPAPVPGRQAAATEEAPAVDAPPAPGGVAEEAEAPAEPSSGEDPIAELARAADERLGGDERSSTQAVPGGEWAVQVGSFGEPGNAERLEARLVAEGFPAYRRPRSNDLVSVYVGPYASTEVAEDVMGRLKASQNLQGLLVKAP